MSLALGILFNILIFAIATFGTSLVIEKYYRGRMKWIFIPGLTLVSGAALAVTGFGVKLLFALASGFSLAHSALIVVGGAATGVFLSFL